MHKRKFSINMPRELAEWVKSKSRSPYSVPMGHGEWAKRVTLSDVVSNCVREVMNRERDEERFRRDARLAWEAMTDTGIRVYVNRAMQVNMGTVDIRLNGEDAHRIIVELDHARAHRDILNMRFQSVWLENMALKRKLKEVSGACE